MIDNSNIYDTLKKLPEKEYAERMYFELRKEIAEKVKRLDNLSTFTITTTTAILGVILDSIFKDSSNPSPFLLLFPIIFIIPVSVRAAANRKDIRKISDYMIECYEKIYVDKENGGWEKYNRKASKNYKTLFNFKHLDFIFSAVACDCAYLFVTFKYDTIKGYDILIACIALLLVFLPTVAISSVYKE